MAIPSDVKPVLLALGDAILPIDTWIKTSPHQPPWPAAPWLKTGSNGDDLPHSKNRVDLDPKYVDEFGFPAARITRQLFTHETRLNEAGKKLLADMVAETAKVPGIIQNAGAVAPSGAIPTLIGDHQLGTCRMGEDPRTDGSVLDRWCRTHQSPNLYVVDTACFPTGFGVNPMVTVMANALRVGTKIVDGGGVIT